jgi:signal transduction histidine kinase
MIIMSEVRLRVLVVEDSRADAELLVHALRQAGFAPEATRVETEADYRAALEQAPDVILCDFSLPQFDAPRALEILRARALDIPLIIVSGSIGEEVAVRAIQQGATDYLLKDRLGRLGQAVRQALAERRLQAAEREAATIIRRQNEELEARVHERTMELEAAKIDLLEMNIALRTANLAKDRFLATMSHELRTPLNAILGFTGVLLMHLPGPLTAEQEKQLRLVDKAAKHLLSLINDMLDVAKIESGAMVLHSEPVALHAVVQEVATTLSPLALARGLRLEVAAGTSEAVVRGDRRALTQIVMNLATNAIKFTPHGAVRIELDQDPQGARLGTTVRVIDTGIGIAAADQGRLFQAFTQIAGATAGRQEGTGLGLYLSRKLAEMMGGVITVQSEPGSGSTFELIFIQ